jgi:hypothetical protein
VHPIQVKRIGEDVSEKLDYTLGVLPLNANRLVVNHSACVNIVQGLCSLPPGQSRLIELV